MSAPERAPANLLVIESWVRAAGLVLPRKLRAQGHHFTFVSRKPSHYSDWARGAGLLGEEAAARHPMIALADEVVTAETNDLAQLIPVLDRLHRKSRFDGVLSICDYYLDTAAEVADALGLPGPTPASMRVARQKHLMREACRRAGVACPRFLAGHHVGEARDFAEEVGYPVVVKAVDLCASEQVFAVREPGELEQAFQRIVGAPTNIRGQQRPRVVLVEEFLRGEEFSVETSSFRGETAVIGVTDKSLTGHPSFIESGVMHPAAIPEATRDAMVAHVREVLTAVGYCHGLTHTEVKLTPDGPRVVEINTRMGGSYLFEAIELVTGVDLFRATVDLALDRRPDVRPGDTGIRSAAVRFLLAPRAGKICGITGVEAVRADPDIHRVTIDSVVGRQVRAPEDNNDFLGHLLAVDRQGLGARRKAEWAAEQIRFSMA
jgi:biotin carboxylase